MTRLSRTLLLLLAGLIPLTRSAAATTPARDLRPPAVPLVACDPYFSVWSCADRLTDDSTRHWTRAPQPLTSMVRIDGKAYRLMGAEPKEAPALPQFGMAVTPTGTMYEFKNEQVRVFLTFTTPALPEDLDLVSRPVTYVTWEAGSEDGERHSVSVYAGASSLLAVNVPDQKVAWSREKIGRLTALKVGTADQPVLQKKGDNLRIDWGYLYQAAPAKEWKQSVSSRAEAAAAFAGSGSLPGEDPRMPRAAGQDEPVLSAVTELGRVGEGLVSRHLILAYDDGYSITYMGRKLPPYWRRNGMDAGGLLARSEREYPELMRRCEAFDRELMRDLQRAGGDRYAQLAALAYRQCLAANKIAADANGQPLLFPKENFSNGCIATVDVIYPMDPLFILFNPTLAKASLAPILAYAASDRWKFPFAPHDLGTYPIANGQVYGGGERTEENQMPVEESGNMLLLLAAVAKQDGNAAFASRYWPQLTRWAEYLQAKGFDPENQLCTDDFAGHLAHNVNLSVKAIEALGAYSLLCGMRGDTAAADRYHRLAAELAKKWAAAADDGDHYRLAFDRPGTWSQKYNLVWDRILGLSLFPSEVTRKELAYYRKMTNRYGLPLDNRENYTKLDWTIWTATLSDNREDWDALVNPVYDFLNDTPDRVPMTDWYRTKEPKMVGFQARSVVGGVYVKLLSDPAVWKKWASRDRTKPGEWAPLPTPPQVKVVVPSSQREAQTWRYTTLKPAGEWSATGYDAGAWKEGPGGFGTRMTPGAVVRTEWNTGDIWMRREFVLPQGPEGRFPDLQLLIHHDEDVEVTLNGVLAAKVPGFTTDYEPVAIRPEAKAALKPGRNVMAVHCHQTGGGQYIDVGLVEVRDSQ